MNHYILITHVLQVSGLMFGARKKAVWTAAGLNSSLIDFNGEILISVWPRSGTRGQSHLLANAGHPVCESQSIILAPHTEKENGRKEEGEKKKRGAEHLGP